MKGKSASLKTLSWSVNTLHWRKVN